VTAGSDSRIVAAYPAIVAAEEMARDSAPEGEEEPDHQTQCVNNHKASLRLPLLVKGQLNG